MTKQQALKILKEYQLWRRGKYPYNEMGHLFSRTPRQIGEAIDIAIKELSDDKFTNM